MFTSNNRGYVLITTMVALAVVALLGAATLTWATSSLRLARKAVESEQALYLANAGVEDALAQFLAGQHPTSIAPHTLTVTGNLQGSYSVTLTTQPDQSISIVSKGVVGGSTRVVTAVMQPSTSSGGTGGSTGGTQPPPPPPGVSQQVMEQAVYSNGSLTFNNNNALICGDLYVVGDVNLGNNTLVRGTATSGCTSVSGTGKVVATGTVYKGNNTVIDGGWCDSTHWGAGTPCATAPSSPPLAAPDFATLSSTATVRYNSSQQFTGAKTYNNDIVYINGDLTLNGLTVQGTVTYAVTGTAYVYSNLTCSGTCNVAIIAANSIQTANSLDLWATLVTNGALTLGNQATVHGNIQAGIMNTGNGPVFYPLPYVQGSGTGPSLKGWNS